MNSSTTPLAYLVSRYPAVSHTFILREVAQLRGLGHTIHTASINPPDRSLDAMDDAERNEALNTYCVKAHGLRGALGAVAFWARRAPRRLANTLLRGIQLEGGLKGFAYAVESAMVARWMQDHKLQHLHVHFGNAGATVGVLVKNLRPCHLSYTIHGPDEFDNVPCQHLALKMHEADAVVCISQFARSQLMRISQPADCPKFQVCRLGVNPANFPWISPATGVTRLRLLCVGRLTPAKCQVLLVQACAQLEQRGVDFSLTVVGEGPDRGRMESAIAQYKLADRVHLTGALTQEGVRRALDQADIFVLPSLAEGIPVVLIEAMSSGVPCISTPVNGIPELIEHGQTGLLATPGDVDSLTDQLQRLASSQSDRIRIAEAARIKIEASFDLDRNVRSLSEIFAKFPKQTA